MKTFVLKARDGFIKKFVPVSMAVGTACSALAVSVSAAEGSSGVDISAVTDSLQSNLIDLATKAALACAGVVAAGLSIFGLKWVVKKIIGFFKVIGN